MISVANYVVTNHNPVKTLEASNLSLQDIGCKLFTTNAIPGKDAGSIKFDAERLETKVASLS